MTKSKEKKEVNNLAPIIVILALILAIGIVFSGNLKSSNSGSINNIKAGKNVEVRNGVQYITIGARGGYLPKESFAKADIPTKLIIKTNGTYDCSSFLVIRSLNYKNMLSQTGETEIDIGTPILGVPLRGMCGMGMYSFVVNFE